MKKYEVIYCDPPWRYDSADCLGKKSLLNKEDNFHYPTMSQDELKAIDVEALCADDCIMYMWVVSPKLDEGIELLKHWGFKYATIAFVWDKQKVNPGYYTMSQVEICIMGKRGKIPQPRGARNVRQFVSLPRGKHSAKPLEVRKRIERMFPSQSKLEIFAREKYPSWDAFGNEFDNDVEIGGIEKEIMFDGYGDYFE